MKSHKLIRSFLAVILCVALTAGLMTFASSAAYNKDFVSETHDVFKSTSSTLAPGVEQYINYAYAKDGKQMVYYVATADITRDDVFVQSSYLKQHENGIMGMEKLTNQIAYANQKYSNPNDEHFISEHYNVVAGVNASFYNMTTGQPMGVTFIDGVSFGTSSYDNFFAVLKDGKTAVIDYSKNLGKYVDENGESTIWQAAAGSQWLVRDGKDVTASASGSYNIQRHSRTCVGITAEGKVVFMVLDGRQEPFSCGGSMHELAQIMLEAGCVAAVNLDGGGSTTYASRPEGSDKIEIINRPSDGSERSISSGLMIASTAVPSNTFDHVTMNAAAEYVTPGTSTEITVAGVSPSGSSAEIPGDISYNVVNGSYENGVLTAGAAGDVVLTAVHGGKEVGSVTIHAVIPESLAFTGSTITVPYGKTVALNIIATYGLNEVKFKASDIDFELSDNGVGSIDGIMFTAGDGAVATSAITATFKGTSVSASATINLGKGSEVLWDFEDGDVSEFYRAAAANYNYLITPGTCSIVTAENGKVHSGNYAMRFNADFSVALESGYMNGRLCVKNKSGERIDLKGATRLGMWIWFPIEAKSLNGRIFLQEVTARNEDGSIKSVNGSYTTATLIDNGGDWDCGFTNEYDEPGWHYVYFNLEGGDWCIPANWNMLDFYINDRDGSKHGYNHFEHKSQNVNVIMYLDDITVDYSSAVDDRDAPVFSDVRWASTSMSDAVSFIRGKVAESTDNNISFGATVADLVKDNATGLDESTAKAYVDGVEVACTIKGGVMSVADCVLADGIHTVKFSICDKQGNYASVIRQINVKANSGISTVKLAAHDATLNNILLGSVYYIDLVATDIEKVQSVSADIDLNNISKWELDHMEVAEGFTASYAISDADENIATVTVTRTGKNDATGEGMLVSMPVRTWELPAIVADGTRNNVWMYPEYRKGNEVWPIDISASVVRGEVEFVDGTTDTFTGAEVQVDTEAHYWTNETKPADYATWNGGHDHRAETKQYYSATATNHVDAVALADKAATCTEAGYTGRTFCEVCNSVVDWGTTVPATGHSYALVDGVLKCSECGDLFNGVWTDGREYVNGVAFSGYILENGVYYTLTEGVRGGVYTGLVQTDGKWGYSKLGVLSGGWVMIDDVWYYFDTTTLTSVETYSNGKVTFEFEENGRLISGQWYATSEGTRYYYGPNYYGHGWHTIDGYDYYFGDANVEPGYRYEGLKYVINSNSHTPQWYDFGTDGKAVKLNSTGLLTVEGRTYYLVNGISQTGLQLIDGKYYYFSGTYEAKKNVVYVSSAKGNGLLPEGYYLFKEDCSMADEEFGVWQNAFRYIRKGQPCFAGLILNAEGKIIYIGSDCTLGKGICTVPANKTNGLLAEGTYAFGEDGVLIDNAFAMWQGNMCYMRNGQPYAAGLVRIGSDIYYVRSSCQAATGMYWVSPDKTNGILETGFYLFADNGALIDGRFADWKGEECYIKMGQPYYAGVIEYNGKLIYVGSNCKMNTGVCYITKAAGNGILEEGYYYFKEDGELLSSGFAKWTDGVTYYFENGQRCAAGAVEVDGSVYYINSGCRPVTGKYFVSANKGNGILEEGYYTFDANGVLISG